jgi:TonB family protein
MSPEPKKVSEAIHEENLGSLCACLVEGDAEQRRRERGVRRRALAISISVQSAVLAALILVPLFGKTERIALGRDYVPIPTYGHRAPQVGDTQPSPGKTTHRDSSFTFNSPNSKPHLRPVGEAGPIGPPEDPIGNQPSGPGCDACIDIGSKESGPRQPQPPVETSTRPQIVHVTRIDPALLIRRVEPKYPALAIQTHREGRVELRAIIGTDGTIQSLQVVSGDPLFLMSARQAVEQWRYRPTYLNGQAVEIDTFITVVYTMQH